MSSLIAALILGLLAQCSGEMSVSVDISENIVAEGADVTVRCRVANYEPGAYIYWWKRQDGQEAMMGVSTNINDVFRDTGRYKAEYESTDDELVFLLNIRGAVPEDSGEIGCQTSVLDSEKEYAQLDVVVSLTDISLWSMKSNDTYEEPVREYEDGEMVPFHEGDEYYFQCRAGGGTYPPAFQMSIGDTDITDLFTQEHEYVLSDGQPGLKRKIYTGKATTHAPVVVTKKQNAKEFRCNARVPGWETSPLTIYVQPELKFPPMVTCPKRVGSDLYDNEIEAVRCVVKSDPPVEEMVWSYVRKVKDETVVELHMHKMGGKYIHKVEDGQYPDELVSTLYMTRVYPEMFRKYRLVVKNALGETEAIVSFVNDNPGASTGRAGSFSASRVFLSIIAAVVLALHL